MTLSREDHMRETTKHLLESAMRAYVLAPEKRGFWTVLAIQFSVYALTIEAGPGGEDQLLDLMPMFNDSVRTGAIERIREFSQIWANMSPEQREREAHKLRAELLR